MKTVSFTPEDVVGIASLANIPITKSEEAALAEGFNTTMGVVDMLMDVDVSKTPPTEHLTGAGNVYREDVVDEERMFTQEQALANAKRTHNGFFVVDQIRTNE